MKTVGLTFKPENKKPKADKPDEGKKPDAE